MIFFLQLVVLALAAVAFAEPEADPLLYYTNTYNYKPVVPVVPKYAAPAAYFNPAMYYNPTMYYNPYNPVVYTAPVAPVVAKEAEPVVDAVEKVEEKTEVVAPTPIVYNVPQYYNPYTVPAVAPVVYKAAPSYYAQSAPGVVHQVAKREADSDAQYYGAYGYGYPAYAGYRYGASPSAYRYGGYPYAYGYGK